MLRFSPMFPRDVISCMKSLVLWILLAALVTSCGGRGEAPKASPILLDTYSLYILDPGVFTSVPLEYPTQREFLVLQAGGVEIACGCFKGAFTTEGAEEYRIAAFARETIGDEAWLPGCNRWMLDAAQVTIGNVWYYCVTLLVRRDADWTGRLTDIQRVVHARELDRFPEGDDMIVRLYHVVKDRDIYIFTLSGTPEEVVVREMDVRRLLASVRLSAVDATQELGQ